jgi:hypothetical protein
MACAYRRFLIPKGVIENRPERITDSTGGASSTAVFSFLFFDKSLKRK